MKNQIIRVASCVVFAFIISACSRDFDNPVGDNSARYSKGSADFSKFVSIGDSLTAGYADGALYQSGQKSSYPAILAQQFATVGGGAFVQPLMEDNLGGFLIGGVSDPDGDGKPDFPNRLVLNAAPKNPPDDLDPTGPEPIDDTLKIDILNPSAPLTGPFNNFGVPGAKSFHLLSDSYGDPAGLTLKTANPYYVRFAPTVTTSMIAAAAAQAPSFFILWIGNNDVLSYATKGGIGTDQKGNLDPATYGANDITDPDVFTNTYNGLVATLTGANADAKGVLINIPDISTIPYFKTVPYNALPLDQATADALNASYVDYNAGVAAALATVAPDEATKRTISFSAGQNAVVISDEDLTDLTGVGLPSIRQATAEDLLILTTSTKIGKPNADDSSKVDGISAPLSDGDVLIPSEIQAIETARQAFNAAIKAAAEANDNLLFFDVAAVMSELSTSGIDYGTGFIDATYATGGGFSLDGVHPTARGYAVVANRIIDVINSGFNANIPPVDPGAYTTIFVK
ncbi:MAG TPA: G-D-S-L family lipolytic protein [Gammaproteobacteria bacterium]|nr:G-D-S-L family lipolytic protein [Gammaproteobacteria bacterium]